MTGPWYYVYRRPRWRLCAHATNAESDFVGHPMFWKRLCAELLGPHYRLSARQVGIAAELCYAMPRGRCSRRMGRRPEAQTYALYHGGDFPSRLDLGVQQRKLVRTFGLDNATQKGQVQFLYDEHERMIPDDQQRLQELLGITIPY